MMTIEDDLVSVDNLIEDYLLEEPRNEFIQSCDIVAFNKICKNSSFCILVATLKHSCLCLYVCPFVIVYVIEICVYVLYFISNGMKMRSLGLIKGPVDDYGVCGSN